MVSRTTSSARMSTPPSTVQPEAPFNRRSAKIDKPFVRANKVAGGLVTNAKDIAVRGGNSWWLMKPVKWPKWTNDARKGIWNYRISPGRMSFKEWTANKVPVSVRQTFGVKHYNDLPEILSKKYGMNENTLESFFRDLKETVATRLSDEAIGAGENVLNSKKKRLKEKYATNLIKSYYSSASKQWSLLGLGASGPVPQGQQLDQVAKKLVHPDQQNKLLRRRARQRVAKYTLNPVTGTASLGLAGVAGFAGLFTGSLYDTYKGIENRFRYRTALKEYDAQERQRELDSDDGSVAVEYPLRTGMTLSHAKVWGTSGGALGLLAGNLTKKTLNKSVAAFSVEVARRMKGAVFGATGVPSPTVTPTQQNTFLRGGVFRSPLL